MPQVKRKGSEVLVEQSPATSVVEVSSKTLSARVTAASEAERGGTSTAPPIGG
jgi:hypothetical protein